MKLLLVCFSVLLLFCSCVVEPTTGPDTAVGPPPSSFFMNQNYPNPFTDTTRVKYGVPSSTTLSIVVYDQFREEVRTIVSNNSHAPGQYIAVWDGKDRRGFKVKSGTYYLEMKGYVPQAAIIFVTAVKQ
ncbi:MAG: FlgD immunoglobulin-like domain containing protein [Bacteroidota bacterium]